MPDTPPASVEPEPRADWLARAQLFFSIITSVAAIFATVFVGRANAEIQKLGQRRSLAETVLPYIKSLYDDRECRTAAVALDWLFSDNDENREMVYRLLISVEKPQVTKYLKQLQQQEIKTGKADTTLASTIQASITTKEGADPVAPAIEPAPQPAAEPPTTAATPAPSPATAVAQADQAERNAINIIAQTSLSKIGWCYLGSIENGRWRVKTAEIADGERPEVGHSYNVTTAVYLRDTEPNRTDYKLGNVVNVFLEGDTLKVLALGGPQDNGRVWAKVELTRQARIAGEPSE